MQYSFFSRSFPDADIAHAAFMQINDHMQLAMPDAFLVGYEAEDGDSHVVVLGCNDRNLDFVDEVEDLWEHGTEVSVSMEVCMALEARHCRLLSQHHDEHPGESLQALTREPIDIMPDGTEVA